ncbi:MAG: cytochrome c [Magnetococcales bacterium]|nr:cytochrome c [Magnetococcales bacterium]
MSRRRVFLSGAGVIALGFAGQADAADPFAGKEQYKLHCAPCHGMDGKPGMPQSPDFARKSDPHNGLLRSDTVLLNRVRQGGSGCPSFRGVLDDFQILDVVSYLRSMKR